MKSSSYSGHWKNPTLQHAFNDVQFLLQRWLSLAVNTMPLNAYYVSKRFCAQATDNEHVVSGRVPQSWHSAMDVIIFWPDCALKGTSGVHSVSATFCGTIMALHCSHLSTKYMSGHRDKESSPTAEFVSSKGFCCACVHYEHNMHTQETATQTGMF